ncbi:hypothetical protein MTR_2g066800 [Medicago truncatula]|uniref:Uncharacterized protein n=1 Tax=Medicago truncatula TaxID=3880 RepID=A0A072V889_MEDTR|nr:hypothetical protein MTR_2g066800 [Medicago truncatula]
MSIDKSRHQMKDQGDEGSSHKTLQDGKTGAKGTLVICKGELWGKLCPQNLNGVMFYFLKSKDKENISSCHRPPTADHHTGTLPTATRSGSTPQSQLRHKKATTTLPSQRFPHRFRRQTLRSTPPSQLRHQKAEICTTTLPPTPNTQICPLPLTPAPKHYPPSSSTIKEERVERGRDGRRRRVNGEERELFERERELNRKRALSGSGWC